MSSPANTPIVVSDTDDQQADQPGQRSFRNSPVDRALSSGARDRPSAAAASEISKRDQDVEEEEEEEEEEECRPADRAIPDRSIIEPDNEPANNAGNAPFPEHLPAEPHHANLPSAAEATNDDDNDDEQELHRYSSPLQQLNGATQAATCGAPSAPPPLTAAAAGGKTLLPRLFFEFQATVDTTPTTAPTATNETTTIVWIIRRATKYMAQCETPAHDFGDLVNMITLLDGWGLIENARTLKSIAEDYSKRLNKTADAQEAELRLFESLEALVPLAMHTDPEEVKKSKNTFLPEAQRLHDVIFDPPDRRTLSSSTPATRLALRDIIPCPASYDITRWWILQMMSSFWLLIVLTFINIDLLNLNYLIQPYVDSSDGCFFESRTDCCNPKLNSAVINSASATTTELFARDVNRSCCSFNCMWNNETFTHYRDRWIDFVGASVGDCARMLLAVGGARVEDTPDLTGPNMLYVPDEWILNLNSSDSSESYINATALRERFMSTCKDSEACQRFVIITQQQFQKEWTNLLSAKQVIHYVVFVESSWRFIDTGCQSTSRRIIVPMSSDTDFTTGALIGGWLLFATALIALIGTPSFLNWMQISIDKGTAHRVFLFWPFVWTSVFLLCVLLGMSFSTALLSPEPNSGLLLLAFCAALRCFFSVVSLLRLIVRLLDSLFGNTHENVLFGYVQAQRSSMESFVSRRDGDSECPHSTTWAETLVTLLCCFYFMSMAGILRDIELEFVGSATRNYLINLFDKWVYHRSLFTIIHLAFVPIGLELVLYVPAWIGYATDSTLPRLRWLVVFYGIVFVWFPNSATSFPTTLDEIGKAVLGFTSQLVTDFGPLGSGQRRLGYAFALLLLFFVFLQLIYDMEAAVLMKPWVVLRAYFIRLYASIHYPNICAFRSKHPGGIGAERAALLTAIAHLPGITESLRAALQSSPAVPHPIGKGWKELIQLLEKAQESRFDHREGIEVDVGNPGGVISTADWTWLARLLPAELFFLEVRDTPQELPRYVCYRGPFTPTIQIASASHNPVFQMYSLACACLGATTFVRANQHVNLNKDKWYCLTASSCSVCGLSTVKSAFTSTFPHVSVFARLLFERTAAATTAPCPMLHPVRFQNLSALTTIQCSGCKHLCITERVFDPVGATVADVGVCDGKLNACQTHWPRPFDLSDTSVLPPIPPAATCVGVTELNEKAAAWIASGGSNIRTVCIINSAKIDADLPPLPQVQRLLFLTNDDDDRGTLQLADSDHFAATFPHLLELAAPCTATDVTLEQISKCELLQSLDLEDTDISALEHLKGLTALQLLNLDWCHAVTDAALQYLTGLTALRSLNLGWCRKVTDDGLQHLSGLKALQSLDLSMCDKITDAGLQYLRGLTALQSLSLSFCDKITDAGLQHLRGLAALESLNLEVCTGVTDAGLQHLRGLKTLQSLNLSSCDKITDAAKQALKQAIPKLEITS